MKINLRELSQQIAADSDLASLQPVIEKEIIHYEILEKLADTGLLSHLTFQGGTCLRLCYGSERYSEDLDFTAGDKFDSLDLDGFTEALGKDLLKTYDVAVHVKKPKTVRDFDGVGMRRWTVVVDTDTHRADLPSQRIKIEVASAPSHTSVIRPVSVNYQGLSSAYQQTLIRCQTPEEIMSDKLISFSATEGYIRHRDLWDIPFLYSMPVFDLENVPSLVESKHADYGCNRSLHEMIAIGIERARTTIHADAFVNQMRRFIPSSLFQRAMARPEYLSLMLSHIEEAYKHTAQTLGLSIDVERARRNLAIQAAADSGKTNSATRGRII